MTGEKLIMKNLLGGLLKAALTEEKKTEVGKVDLSLAFKLVENDMRHDAAHEEIKKQVEAFIEKLHKEHEPVCQKFADQRDAIWVEIYEAAGIPEEQRKKRHSIDKLTGVVSRIDSEEDSFFEEATSKIFH